LIAFIEPISKNVGMYIPAYPLPIMEIASYARSKFPDLPLRVISIPVDYGLPLSREGKDKIYGEVLKDLFDMHPIGVGISCTAIAQAEEVIHLCELIKKKDPGLFVFIGGYFPTIYYEDVLSRTSAVDAIVLGEGEVPTVAIIERLQKGQNPIDETVPNLVWKRDGQIHFTQMGERFDLRQKALLDLDLLKFPKAYEILPYAFSRGCPYHCTFCMEESMRPIRKEVPEEIVRKDLKNLSRQSSAQTLLVSDALFKSFDLLPFIRSLGMKVNFETRSDVLDPVIIPGIADACEALALGFESASYSTLKRMNKVRDRNHYEHYISNTKAIFRQAVAHEIPIMVFMIAGFPGDTVEDLEESLAFAEELSESSGSGGHVFKIGECRVYPKTRLHEMVSYMSDVHFDDNGVFGDNIVTRPSRDLDFDTVVDFMKKIFDLSHNTPSLRKSLLKLMPFFRLTPQALGDEMIPDTCFLDQGREIFNAKPESLSAFREIAPILNKKYTESMSGPRSTRHLPL